MTRPRLRPRWTDVANHDELDRNALIRRLRRRDAERQLGRVWERDEIEPEAASNDRYVALAPDADLGHGDTPWDNRLRHA